MKNKLKNPSFIFVLVLAVLAVIRFIITYGLPILAIPLANYDDGLLFELAKYLESFHWLGPYTKMTLIKGPFFPFFLSLCHWFHIPFLTAETLLYISSCIFVVIAILPAFKNKWTTLPLYIMLLFNPIMFSGDTFQRVYRSGITLAFELFVFAGMLGAYLRIKQSSKKVAPFVVIAAFAYTFMIYSRDETVWILPFLTVVIIILIILTIINEKRFKQAIYKSILLLLPFILQFSAKHVISAINYHQYGIYTVVETSGTNFAKTMQIMNSIEFDNLPPCVSISRDKMKLLYTVSPTLNTWKDDIELWLDMFDSTGRLPDDGENEDGFFYFAFKQAIDVQNGEESEFVYGKIYDELNSAVSEGKLKCGPLMPSALMSPWREEFSTQLPNVMLEAHQFIYDFKKIYIDGKYTLSWSGPGDMVYDMEQFTYERAIYSEFPESYPLPDDYDNYLEQVEHKSILLRNILTVYQMINPIIFYIALIGILFMIINIIRGLKLKKYDSVPVFLMTISILLSYIVCIGVIGYSNITAYVEIGSFYLSSTYPIILMTEGLSLAYIISLLIKLLKKLRPN